MVILDVTLCVSVGTWRLPHGISLTTRLYNGTAPGPTLYASPGDRLHIRLQNRLGPNTPSANDNASSGPGFRQANTTSLHLHGIYEDAYHDDTFTPVRPSEERAYGYRRQREHNNRR